MPILLNCKTCDSLISEEALICPKCGQPKPLDITDISIEDESNELLGAALGFVMYQTFVYTDNFKFDYLTSKEFLNLIDDIPGGWSHHLNDDFRKEDGNLFKRFQFAFEIINQIFTKNQLKDLFFHIISFCANKNKTEKSALILGIVNLHIALSDEEKSDILIQNQIKHAINKNDNIQICSKCSLPIDYSWYQSGGLCSNCKKYNKRKYSSSDWFWGIIGVFVIMLIVTKCSK